ncbi:MAG: hypothetical protein HYX25_09360 [Candidatus Solibacter usitatus]|nr:hypothetical protein [Candidatus Solibacter usitatus]
MNRVRLTLAALTLSLGAVFSPALQASDWDRKTVVTINAPIEVSGMVLSPGTYVFKLLDSNSERNIVLIYNAEENHLVTTVLAVPSSRMKPTSESLFTLSETPAGQPRALHTWFYPGNVDGVEFRAIGHARVAGAGSGADSTNGAQPSE